MPEVRKASREDGATAGEILASAFAADPIFTWMLGTTAGAEIRLRRFFTRMAQINLARPTHEVYVTEEGDGLALWSGIDDWKVSNGDLVRLFPTMVRTFRFRLPSAMSALGSIEKVHPREPHYYLEFLATRSDRQGKGIGTTVIAPMLQRCDTEGVPAYLENSNPRNEAFYFRHGFKVSGQIDTPQGCPPMTPMWREPR